MLDLQIFDSRHVWWKPALQAAMARGWKAKRITKAPSVPSRFGFIRPHPAYLSEHQAIDAAMRDKCGVMVQDRDQVVLYDDKIAQASRYAGLLPDTRIFTDKAEALAFEPKFPLISKASEGASSVNVRVINNLQEYRAHVDAAFSTAGIEVNRCADGTRTTQRGYVLLQRFIPHDRTYRVNVIGNCAAIFERFNYKDRPVAQTGNTAGVYAHDMVLLQEAFDTAWLLGTKWCAFDFLWDAEHGKWVLLETSLAWPWNEKDYSDVPFFDHETGEPHGTWGTMWDVLYDQLESGVFGSTSA